MALDLQVCSLLSNFLSSAYKPIICERVKISEIAGKDLKLIMQKGSNQPKFNLLLRREAAPAHTPTETIFTRSHKKGIAV